MHVKCTVGKHCTTSIQCLLLRPVRIHVHHNTGVIVSQVSIFPTSIHHTSVIHNHRIPVCILIKCQTAEIFTLRRIKYHVSYRVAPIDTGYSLVTDVRIGYDTSIRQISPVIKFQIRFGIINQFLTIAVIQFYFKHIPTIVRHCLGKHRTVSIPMQFQIGNGRSIVRLINSADLYFITQIT